MKKLLSSILVIIMLISLIGCSGKPATQQTSNAAQAKGNAEQETIVIKFGHAEPEERSVHKSIVEFEKYVEAQTDGKVDIQILPNGQLGGERQLAEAVSLGTLQMTTVSTAVLTTYDEKFSVLDLPFLFKNREAAYKAVDNDLGKQLNDLLPSYNMISLGYQDNGLRHITNSVRPINTPDDLKGIKIRVMENPMYINLFKALGANPTPMSFGEVYTALQQGTVDAQENGPSLVYSSKFHEVQKYYSLTGHVYSFDIALVNADFFNELPDDVKKAINEGAEKYIVKEQRAMESGADKDFLEKLTSEGMQINEITPENRVKFEEKVQSVYDSYKEKIGAEIIEKAKSFNQ